MLKSSKYRDYDVEAFINDSFFVEWVNNKNSKNNFFWEKWISNHPEKLDVVLKAKNIISSIGYKNKYERNEKDFIEVLENILESRNNNVYNKSKNRYYTSNYIKIAATILLILVCGTLLWYEKEYAEPRNLEKAVQHISVTKHTAKGQKLLLTLNDGTVVKLNSNTKLTYPKKFSNSQREVYLEGEAFFDVSKDSHRPFIIHSGTISTKVLGTSFNVESYPEKEQITVAVVTGKVQVISNELDVETHQKDKINLIPNEALVYKKTDRSFQKKIVSNMHELIGWKDNLIIFNKASFEEMVGVLEKHYGVNFQVKRKIKMGEEGFFSGEYENEPLSNVLESLSFAGNFNFEIKKSIVTIY